MEVLTAHAIHNIVKPLQWDHDKIVMEVGDGEFIFSDKPVLQWGHDKIVMEVAAGCESGRF